MRISYINHCFKLIIDTAYGEMGVAIASLVNTFIWDNLYIFNS